MCQYKNFDVHNHTCAVMYQLAAISGHIMHPEHFPILPPRKRPWTSASNSGPMDLSIETTPEPADKRARTEASEVVPIESTIQE